ncbi:hypothetical protein RJT34_01580 [Clitoria ternatea]|uniref:Uncharacterized protein n=1 Tax=Clitoria ternatea TaxID=43366 RepID=A0AAN9KHU7_CLITE
MTPKVVVPSRNIGKKEKSLIIVCVCMSDLSEEGIPVDVHFISIGWSKFFYQRNFYYEKLTRDFWEFVILYMKRINFRVQNKPFMIDANSVSNVVEYKLKGVMFTKGWESKIRSMKRIKYTKFTARNVIRIRIHFEKPQVSSDVEIRRASKDVSKGEQGLELAVMSKVMAEAHPVIQLIIPVSDNEEDKILLREVLSTTKRKTLSFLLRILKMFSLSLRS